MLVTVIEQGDYLAQVAVRGLWTLGIVCQDGGKDITPGIHDGISLFRDGEAGHLQGRGCENLFQPGIFLFV